MASGTGGDESLEIVFWWLDGESKRSIEEDLDDHLEPRTTRRRPWPRRRGSDGP
jgi:hypothetical protein